MNRIIWNHALIINLRRYDEQHERLVCIVNQLCEAIEECNGNDALCETFFSLTNLIAAHLADEENLLLVRGFSVLAEQKAEEEKIIKHMLLDLRKQSQADGFLTDSVLTLLRDWLVNHISKDCILYGPYLTGYGTKPSGHSRTVGVSG